MTPQRLNRIVVGDCLRGLRKLPDGVVDLVFADPPFNIGYQYDAYEDRLPVDEYLEWSRTWMKEVKRVLKPNGTFWLAIGDEHAAELKVLATRDLGFACRSWVIWYYTFGVHCEAKFSRSHAHLFHFVCDPEDFVFNDDAVRVPSARQLVYADKRANPKGRVPDDTWIIVPVAATSWILRPQDVPEGFTAQSDTWYFPRVCGTFRERMGFHGCQMPEQLLGRIMRACTDEGHVVIDPFAGSGTTLAVAKKLNRRYLGFEISPNYAKLARKRLDRAKIGSPLDGSENPVVSATTKRSKSVFNGHQRRHNRSRTKPRGKQNGSVLRIARYSPRQEWVGLNLVQIAEKEGTDPLELAIRISRSGGAAIVNFSMDEGDVRHVMKRLFVATASDGRAYVPSADRPHPRSYGTFAR
ncbi:MAG: hypothetical protein IH888_11080, partial [Planctomycetes bacterium]|nr:hypothetical protein [Planctomycetota bacterium]